MRLLCPFKGRVFKNGWRQAYPALAFEKHDALHFRFSVLDSDWSLWGVASFD
jgi:hypothetical protein